MKIKTNDPPREYECGFGPKVTMKDCAHIELAANEQITLKTDQGGEYDVARKSWGFYATPSINGRLERFGFRTALVKNRLGQYFIMLVEQGEESKFQEYLIDEGLVVTAWLDEQTFASIDDSLSEAA